MAQKVKVIILRTAGTNCDQETGFAFEHCGANVDYVHINQLFSRQVRLKDYHILAIPGGFTYGDDIESGRILANELCARLGADIHEFIGDLKLIIGICNGFQVLVKSGILPGPLDELEQRKNDFSQKATLVSNDSGQFIDRWTYLKVGGKSVWTDGLKDVVYYPVAHAEGKFIPQNNDVLTRLDNNGQIAFRYSSSKGSKPNDFDNPNGSVDDIAGITDQTGRILGMMPHPERHFLFVHHPRWTRANSHGVLGDGAKIFQNGVDYVKKKLLS